MAEPSSPPAMEEYYGSSCFLHFSLSFSLSLSLHLMLIPPSPSTSLQETYIQQMNAMGMALTRQLSLALGLAEGDLDAYFTRPMLFIRLLHYSTDVSAPEKGVFGAGAHTDYGVWTFLRTDDVAGLQIQTKEGAWLDVPGMSGAFIVNLGDMLEYWTGWRACVCVCVC